jgi:hypothetical protein
MARSRRVRRRRLRLGALFLVVGCRDRIVPIALPGVDSLFALDQRATFVLGGRVVEHNASRVDVVPASPHTIVVEVDRFFKHPLSTGERTGVRFTTLYVPDARPLPIGTTVIVFGTGWAMSDNVAVLDVGHFVERDPAPRAGGDSVPKGGLIDRFTPLYKEMAAKATQFALCAELRAASLVTVARAASMRELPDTMPPILRSEHSPIWSEAALAPLHIVKRDTLRSDSAFAAKADSADTTPIAVLTPRNKNFVWRHHPRIPVDTVRLFFLYSVQSDTLLFRAVDRRARYYVRDTLDIRPVADTSLLQCPTK